MDPVSRGLHPVWSGRRDYTSALPSRPGFQLVLDWDDDGTPDGIVTRGQTGSHVVTVKNQGPDAATDVLASLASPTCGVTVTSTGGGKRVGNLVVWPTLSSLASGSSTSYTVTLEATAKGSFKVAGAAASLRTPDPVLSSNVSVTAVTVR